MTTKQILKNAGIVLLLAVLTFGAVREYRSQQETACTTKGMGNIGMQNRRAIGHKRPAAADIPMYSLRRLLCDLRMNTWPVMDRHHPPAIPRSLFLTLPTLH